MHLASGPEILTVAQHAEADRLAAAAGIPGAALMEAAGAAVADAIQARWTPRPTLVLCGPGNNGGDGFVVARLLQAAGWPVRVAAFPTSKGDAAAARAAWGGPTVAVERGAIPGAELVIDAIFGAGFARALDGLVVPTLRAVSDSRIPVVAVDVPSGIAGDTGSADPNTATANLTVTFFRKKAAHLLYPARKYCGEVVVADIGTPASVLDSLGHSLWENGPSIWRLPQPAAGGHKYQRGHVLVMSGGALSTGASRLAAEGALRAGAGLVTLAGSPDALRVHAEHVTEILLEPVDSADGMRRVLGERKRNAVIVGPGNGLSDETRDRVLVALKAGIAVVLDADALTAFADQREVLLGALRPGCVLTPHDGEFARLFPAAARLPDRLARARAGAAEAGVVVVLKGPDTVIAHPDGRAIVNTNAPPELASAGSGDVLAGFVAGLRAQGMGAFTAAAAAVWLHGEVGSRLGRGLIASDLHRGLPAVLHDVPTAGSGSLSPPPLAIRVEEVEPLSLAAAPGRGTQAQLPQRIPPAFSKVYDALRAGALPHRGVNVVLYLSGPKPEFSFECGVVVPQPCPPGGAVRGIQTPGGRVVRATHWGTYAGLPDTHRALHAWCRAHGEQIAGLSWEVYGHWSDDPDELRTDVYYQLR